MSLADCFAKAGKALSGEDRAAIEALVESGMGEMQAVEAHLLQLDESVETQGAELKGIDMSQEARMTRAEAMGFDTGTVWYRGSSQDETQSRAITWITKDPELASGYAEAQAHIRKGEPNVAPVFNRANNPFDADQLSGAVTVREFVNEVVRQSGVSDEPTISRARELIGVAVEGARAEESGPHYSAQDFWYESGSFFGKEGAQALMDVLLLSGFDSVSMTESGQETLGVLGNNIRSINAAFDPDHADSAELLAQPGDNPRGFYNRATREITLTKNADPTTFLHETAHYWLDVMWDLAGAHESVQADIDVLEKWWADNGATSERAKHEMFASGFETYLGEGKAPTPELQSLFASFKAWLMMVYRDIGRIFGGNDLEGVQLSDDVRRMMDGLLATDEAIKQAQQQGGYDTAFTAEELGATPEEAAEYGELIEESRRKAEEQLQIQVMREMQRAKKAYWRTLVRDEADGIRDEIDTQPAYRARDFLSGDRVPDGVEAVKLDTATVRQFYGAKASRRLNRMTAQGGAHPDVVAPMFGYQNGDELVAALLGTMNKSDRESYVQAQAEEAVRAERGDLLTDGSLPEAAQAVVRNDKQADRLMLELRMLNRAAGKGRPQTPRQYFQAMAERAMRAMPVGQIRPGMHRQREVQARNRAVKAATSGDYQTAATEMHRAVRQFYLHREATKAQEEAGKHVKRLAQIKKVKYSARDVDPHYLQMAKVLVAAYDFRKNPKDSQALLARVQKFIAAQKEANPDLIADEMLSQITSWRDMTVEDLKAVRSTADNLIHIGKENGEAAKEEMRQTAEGLAAHIRRKMRKEREPVGNRSMPSRMVKFRREFGAAHRKYESWIQQLDGWEDNGTASEELFRGLWDAQLEEVRRGNIEHERMGELLDGFGYLFKASKATWQDLPITRNLVETIEARTETGMRRMTRGEAFVLLLNYGNEGNREALRTQERWAMDDAAIMDVVKQLSPEELELANRVWEYVDSFYPELAQVEQKATGIAPEKVQASPFEVNGVAMRGGYYPLQSDKSLTGWKEEKDEINERAERMMQGRSARATTKHGATIERVGFGGRVVDLSIDTLARHVDGVVHDITHREAIMRVDRLLRSPEVRQAIDASLGAEHRSAMADTLVRVAAGSRHPSELASINKIFRWSRIAASYGAMGYSARTALINWTGLFPAIPEVGGIRLASAVMRQIMSPVDFGSEITSKSVLMENRGRTINRDVYEILRTMKGSKAWSNVKAYAFWGITVMDAVVSRAVWDAAYHKSLQGGADEQQAIFDADRTVQRTQGSGLKIDLSAVEDQSEIIRGLTPMYSYFNAIANLSVRMGGKMANKQISKWQFAQSMFWIMMAPAILEEIMFGDDSDDDDWTDTLKRYGGAQASYFLGQWFGIRELGSYFKYGDFFETPLQSTLAAPVVAAAETGELLFDPDAEFDKGSLRAYTSLAPVLGIPTGAQINRTGRYLMELEEKGGDVSPYGLLFTGRHDDD